MSTATCNWVFAITVPVLLDSIISPLSPNIYPSLSLATKSCKKTPPLNRNYLSPSFSSPKVSFRIISTSLCSTSFLSVSTKGRGLYDKAILTLVLKLLSKVIFIKIYGHSSLKLTRCLIIFHNSSWVSLLLFLSKNCPLILFLLDFFRYSVILLSNIHIHAPINYNKELIWRITSIYNIIYLP